MSFVRWTDPHFKPPKIKNGTAKGIAHMGRVKMLHCVICHAAPPNDAHHCRSGGQARFMHASKNHRQVVLDQTISQYLNAFRSHAGLIVARPLSTGREVTSRSTYEANLRSLGA